MEQQISKERERSRERTKLTAVDSELSKTFGFVPNPSMSPFKNAIHLFGNTRPDANVFPIPSNMAFHDLTPDQSAPLHSKLLLGL